MNAVAFVTPPIDRAFIVGGSAKCLGESAVLSMSRAAAGSTFRWSKQGNPIDTLANPSAATATLTIANVQPSDAGSYHCVVTNTCGSALSNPADLNVYCDCPTYTQLGGVIDSPGFAMPADPAFPSSVLASALNNENPRPLLDFDQIPGTTPGITGNRSIAHTFTAIPNDLISASLRFRIRSGPNTNPAGEGTDLMRLGFASGSGLGANFAAINPARPYWTRFFGVGNATDAYFPSTTWGGSIDRSIVLDLTALPNASQQAGSVTNLLPEIIARSSLDFVVADDSGVDFAELTGVRASGPTVAWVRTSPRNAVACSNVPQPFDVTAAGTGPFTYQWQWQPAGPGTAWAALGDGINADSQGIPTFDASGSTTPSMNIDSISGLGGNFRCIVTNACGSATSDEATLAIPRRCSLADIVGTGTAPTVCGDSVVDGSDFIAFINSFSTGDPAVDALADVAGGGDDGLTPDGIIDGSDFIAFINAFSAGC